MKQHSVFGCSWMGLGLAISKQLCELMGGEIMVESASGRGSTFWFTVRFEPATGADAGRAFFGALPEPRRVLIVEPSDHVRRAAARQLRSWGVDVHDYSDPTAARAALSADGTGERFDAALIARSFADTDGAAFATELAQLGGWERARFVLILGADGHRCDPPIGRHVFHTHLMKPIVPSDLLRCLDDSGDAVPGADGDEALDRVAATQLSRASGGRRLRILLAEDNVVNQTVARAFLMRAGHLVDIVENGQLAIAAVQRTAYDVVLMDIQMPGMDGVAATQAIRRLDGPVAKVPIIALTANAMVGDEEKYRSMGADGYVSKPIEPVELFNAIGQCCGTDFEPTSSISSLDAKSRPDVPPEVAEEAAKFMDSLDDLMDRTD